MKLLAIDTSSDACSVALSVDDRVISRFDIVPRRHAEVLLPMIDELMLEAGMKVSQLDVLAMACGPGAFTGLRVAAGVVQGLAFSADLPVALVSTLTALAQRGWREQGARQVLAGFDARLQEVYWSACRLNADGFMIPDYQELVCRPENIPVPDSNGWLGLGSAWQTYGDVLSTGLGDRCQQWQGDYYPHAIDVALLGGRAYENGQYVDAVHALPVYLRNNVAKKSSS